MENTECFKCGLRKKNINEMIVKGYDAKPGSFPWHAALFHRKRSPKNYACGGTLISPSFVLTANHCVKDENGHFLIPKRIFVWLGVNNLDEPNTDYLQQHDVFKIHRCTSSQERRYDIALLELNTEVSFNDYVQPACINHLEGITDNGTTVGWGYTEDDELSPILKASKMPIVSTEDCLEYDRETFGSTLDKSLFCAGNINGSTVCNGDSGGGLHVKRGEAWYVLGIVAFGAEDHNSPTVCKKDGYAAFTNVAFFAPWIGNVTGLIQDKSNNYFPRDCGVFMYNRIVGGSYAHLFEFPWMALLAYQITDTTYEYHCGGSLINERYVLTAAHCVRSKKPSYVRLGEHDLSQAIDCNPNDADECAPPVQDIDVEYTIRHQNYSMRSKHNDIGLVRLACSVTFEDHIQPVCLPVTQTLRDKNLRKFIITGFGITDSLRPNTLSNILIKATVQTMALDDCQNLYGDKINIDKRQLCAGKPEDGRDTCNGDGGGPLGYPVRSDGIRFVQFGVTSFGTGNCKGSGIYTNLAHFMDWIHANMEPW